MDDGDRGGDVGAGLGVWGRRRLGRGGESWRFAVLRQVDEEPPVAPLALAGPEGWRLLPGLVPGAMLNFDLRGFYLLVCDNQGGQVVDLRSGAAVWREPQACPFFWEVSYG